jgi:hypothetical protein
VPKPTADPVADHGAADGAGDHEADLWRGAFAGGRTVATACAVHHEEGGRITWTGPGSAATGAQRRGKVVAAPQPGAGREHAGQAESRERPLARRPARIARPARVRMRRRNPWVLARRRLFGWKVRLLTRGLPYDGLERRQRCLRQGGGPMRPAPVGRPRRNGNQWTAWTHDNGRRDGSTGSRYVRSSRPVKPNRAGNRPGNTTAQPDRQPPTVTPSNGHVRRDTPPSVHIAAKKSDGLWTTACWRPLVWVASPSAGRLPYPPACDAARLPRWPRDADGGPCVHRLWMTVWTSVITGQTGR